MFNLYNSGTLSAYSYDGAEEQLTGADNIRWGFYILLWVHKILLASSKSSLSRILLKKQAGGCDVKN